MNCTNLTFASEKRRRLHWTAEEEEMPKEGVEKFSTKVNKNLPWKQVLEFGCHVFYPPRTPSDLKDKWRNIMAKESSAISRSRMLRCPRNACVCALIAACIILSMSSWPLLIEARIPEFGAIQGSLIRQSMTDRLIRRSLKRIPNGPKPPVQAPSDGQQD